MGAAQAAITFNCASFPTCYGSAFAGHLVAGGAVFKWRGKAKSSARFTPPGVCHHLGIELTFAIPKNAQAKIAERTFAVLSRSIDDRPEFSNAHSGHAPGAAPDKSVIPVSLAIAESVLRREVDRHNREAGRRSQGARGRSYEQVFQAGLANRIPRKPTAQQLYYASLIYSLASVDRWGRVQADTWTYGQPDTQAELLPWHGKGQIFFGRNPDDFDAPAVAFTAEGRLICKGIQPVKAGVCDSVDGAREAAKNRKAARAAVNLGAKANDNLSDKDMAAALALLRAPEATATVPAPTVVGGRFGAPLQPKRRASAKGASKTTSAITPEMMANFDKSTGFDRFLEKAVR